MPFPTPSFKFITTGQGPGRHVFVFAVADRQLANFLIFQGGARVLQIDAGPTVTLYHLQADIDLTPLIRHFTEAVTPAPACDTAEALLAKGYDPALMTDAQQKEVVADAISAVRTAARRAGKANRRRQVNQVLHECKRRLQAALAQEKGRMRKAGLPEAEVLAILEAAAGQLPEFINRLNAWEIS